MRYGEWGYYVLPDGERMVRVRPDGAAVGPALDIRSPDPTKEDTVGTFENPKETRGADEAADPKPADPAEGQDDGTPGAPGGEGEETELEKPE